MITTFWSGMIRPCHHHYHIIVPVSLERNLFFVKRTMSSNRMYTCIIYEHERCLSSGRMAESFLDELDEVVFVVVSFSMAFFL